MLKNSLFKKLLLNPGLSYNVDEDGNDPSVDNTQIVEVLPGHEGISGSSIGGVSKLRARNAQQLADTNERYQGKTVKRAELADTEQLHEDYDPSLAKFFLIEDSDEEDEDGAEEEDVDEEEDGDEEDEGAEEEEEELETEETPANDIQSNGLQNDFERFADDDFEDGDDDDEEDGDDNGDGDSGGFYSDTGYEEASDSQANSEEDSNQEDDEDEGVSDDEDVGAMKVAGQEDISEEQQKAKSVVKQLGLYEKMFAARINMQKVVRGSLHLPQPPARQAFLQQKEKAGEQFTACLEAATEAAEGLVQELLMLQEAVLKSNPESKCILKGDSSSIVLKDFDQNAPVDDDDEEITSSEDESDEKGKATTHRRLNTSSGKDGDGSDVIGIPKETMKRKRDAVSDLKELEETLAKRHRAMRPYRNKIVAFWDERTRLLQAQSKAKDSKASGGAFAAFDEGFGIMVQRLLADREKLLKRTQLRSIARENLSVPIGSKEVVVKQEVDVDLDIPKATSQSQYERYDPEIYDDTDFYTRYLEEIIKGQHRRGTSGLSTAQFLDITQRLRKKNKKVVDTRRSKGRKLKYDVISSLLQYLPPCGTTSMEDEAVEQVTMSLFGGCHNKQAGALQR